jgi:hypothetical protein
MACKGKWLGGEELEREGVDGKRRGLRDFGTTGRRDWTNRQTDICGAKNIEQGLKPGKILALYSARLKPRPRKKQNGDLPMVGICGFPPIEQKNARWMGHSFIPRGPATPVGD